MGKSETGFKPLDELTLMDDYMFSAVMRDKVNLKPLLEYILKTEIDDIEFIEPQKTQKEGYQSHGIRLDLYVKDRGVQFTPLKTGVWKTTVLYLETRPGKSS